MFDFEKLLVFCSDNGLTYEEFMLLYSLHVRHLHSTPHLHPLINDYVVSNSNKIDWTSMIEKLRDRGFLITLKDKDSEGKWRVKDLQIDENFVSLLFADPDEVWKKFVKRYPTFGLAPGGTGTFMSSLIKEGDKEYFNQFVYKNATPEKAEEILSVIESMFDWDEEGQCVPPDTFAHVSISRFLRNWETYVESHQNKEDAKSSNWNVRL